MISPTTGSLGLWVAWLLGWFVAARSTATTVARQSIGARLAHSVLLWAGGALLFVRPQRFGVLAHRLLPRGAWIAWGGVVVVALGLAYTVWARAHLGRLWSATVTLKEHHTLIRSGPYALSRHPIYTGLLLALIGTLVTQGTVGGAAGLALLVSGIMLKIRQEERLLLEHFGTRYRAYQEEVPRLVPGLRRGRRLGTA